jgi:heme-degrading monooxygenase HmoA
VIVVANRFHVEEDHADAFVERFAESSGIEDQPGCVRFEFLEPVRGDTYVSMTYWESMEDFRNWTDSAHFESVHEGSPGEDVVHDSDLEIHEVAFERP